MKLSKGITVRPKGHHFYVFMNYNTQRFAFQYDTEAEAVTVAKAFVEAKNSKMLESMIAGMKKPDKTADAPKEEKPTVATLKEFYEKTMTPLWKGSVTSGTLTRYATSFSIHILPALGNLPVNEIDRDRLKAFVATLTTTIARKRAKTEESLKNEKERHLSKDSIRLVVAALRAALTEAVEMKLIAANPAVKLGKFYSEAGHVREEVDPFKVEEIPPLLNAAHEHFGFESYVLILCALHTGLRAGELAGLHWSDIDFAERFIIVRRQFRNGIEKRTKTKKLRKVDISDSLLQELQALRKLRKENCLAAGTNEIPEWVFLSPGKKLPDDKREIGQPVDMDNFRNRVFWIACDKAKIRRRRFHDCRHTFATVLIMNGESLAYVKEQCGHSSIKITVDVYGHWIPGANRQAVNKLPSRMTPQSASKAAGD